MVKAALLTPNLSMGGAEMWVVSLASSADRRRLKWTGAVISGWGGLDPYLCRQLAAHVPVHTNEGHWKQNPDAWDLVDRHCEQVHKDFGDAIRAACRDADILVAWGGVNPRQYAPDLDIPIVQTSHTTEPASANSCDFSYATHLAAVSEAATSHFSLAGCSRDVAVIYNGANWQRCQPRVGREAIREQWGLGPNDTAVGYIGRHSVEKNPQAAIDAVACLPKDYFAVYYGGPTARDPSTTLRLREQAKEIAPDRVIFREPVEHVGDPLAGLDVFMLASQREAFSLGLIEAWLAGVPVVATPVGSLPELQEEFGRLTIPVSNGASPHELAAAVRRARDSEGQRIAQHAREVAMEHFTSEAMTRRWADYLQDIVAPHRKKFRRRKRKSYAFVAANPV